MQGHVPEEDKTDEQHITDVLSGEMIPLSELSDTVEQLVIRALENKGLSRTEIARLLGISRQALYKKMNRV